MPIIDGRVRHYGTFYGVDDAGSGPRDGGPQPTSAPHSAPDLASGLDVPLVLIHGNCQAEALRVVLATAAPGALRTIRIPPVFELTAADLPHLARVAAAASVLVSQPVHEDYGQLPLGTAQVAALLPAGSTVLRFPVIRFAGFHPWQTIVRDPREPSRNPPLVPYHDLRTLAAARHASPPPALAEYPAPQAGLRAVADASRAELARRELRDCDVAIGDLFDQPAAGDMITINHPGNRILVELGRRIQQALGVPVDAVDPGRTLLGAVVAPVAAAALRSLGVTGTASPAWTVDGTPLPADVVHLEQWRWYRDNPWVADAGYARHADAMTALGLA